MKKENKIYILGFLYLLITHFFLGLVFRMMSKQETDYVVEIISSLLFALVMVIFFRVTKLWNKQWRNEK